MKTLIVGLTLLASGAFGAHFVNHSTCPANEAAHPAVVVAKAPRGYAAFCTWHRGDDNACLWMGKVRLLESDARGDGRGHENANPGHRVHVEETQ